MKVINGKRMLYMNAAELLDTVFDVYKKCFWQQLGITMSANVIASAALMALLIAAAAVIASAGSFWYDFSNFSLSGGRLPSGVLTGGALIILLIILFLFVYSLWAAAYQAAGIIAARQAFYGQRADLGAALKQTLRALFRLATVCAAEVLITIPFLLIWGAVLAVYVYESFNSFSENPWIYRLIPFLTSPIHFILFTAILILFILTGTVAYNYFALAIPISLFQRRYFFGALVQSYRMIRGRFWQITGIQIVFIFVRYCVSYSFTLIFYVLSGLFSALPSSAAQMAAVISISVFFQLIASLAVGACAAPLGNILTGLLYINQKIEKEGLDIDLRLAALERDALDQKVNHGQF